MKIEQLYTLCLAEAAYYIESEGNVAIIDPLREYEPYVNKAKENNAKIKYIFETHFHADFVSGHVTLAEKTGADIVFGPTAKTNYTSIVAEDQQVFPLGKVKIKVLHTPGHTQESSSYLLIDENGKEHALFTGDTLFIGDVGRPDLAVKSDLTQEDLASMLYDSLRNQIMTLPDEVIIYPAHGAGSACGKNMSKETFDTLGHQKEVNYALRADMTKAEFIAEVTNGLATPPQYFPKNAVLNKQGYVSIDTVLEQGNLALDLNTFQSILTKEKTLILDTRNAQVFKDAFIPNSINIGIEGSFAPWVGALIEDIHQAILIIAEEGKEEEVITRLSRIGYDNTLGFLKGGIQTWIDAGKTVDRITSISAESFAKEINENSKILDVRKTGEFASEHIDHSGVENFPLDILPTEIGQLDPNQNYYIHCAGGYRSMIFASILKSKGFDKIIDVVGGFGAISKTTISKTAFVCPSTL